MKTDPLDAAHAAKCEAMKRRVCWCESPSYNGWCVCDRSGTVWPFDSYEIAFEAYGDMVAKHLPNSRHIIVKGAGHNVLPIGCMPKLFAKFLETADAKALDISCIESLTYSPMFTGFYGSEP